MRTTGDRRTCSTSTISRASLPTRQSRYAMHSVSLSQRRRRRSCGRGVLEAGADRRRRVPTGQVPGPALALILVNYELPRALMERLWFNATLRVCADGAINRLYDTFASDEERARFIPEYVRGDLDSVEEAVIDYYRQHGSIIIKDTDQDTTDLEKCILLIQQNWTAQRVEAREVFLPSAT